MLISSEESHFPLESRLTTKLIEKREKGRVCVAFSSHPRPTRKQGRHLFWDVPSAKYRAKTRPRGGLELSALAHLERNVTLRAQNYSTRPSDRSDPRDFQGEPGVGRENADFHGALSR